VEGKETEMVIENRTTNNRKEVNSGREFHMEQTPNVSFGSERKVTKVTEEKRAK